MAAWEDEALGAFGSGANVPTGEWFDVNTETGQWGTPTPTLASDAGVNWAGVPDLIPTRTMAPSPMMGGVGGAPDQAPLAIGQVAGTLAPPMTTPRSMQRVQRLDEMGALTRQPGMWETIARGVGMLSPQGSAILQASDQQQQQQLQNRLTLRRQELAEQQDARAQVRERFNSFAKLGEIKNKALRNLYADRLVKEMQDSGETFPADFVETFKKSSLKEGEQLTKFITPLLTDLGMDPAEVGELIASGNFDQIKPMLELAQKVKKDKTEQMRLDKLDTLDTPPSTLGDASGTTAPATPGAPTTASTAGTRPGVAAPSAEYTTAIDEAHSAYPTVRKALIPAIIAGESNWDTKAVSPKGAQGPMQLMPAAQKEMGVTDPFDVTQNVRGGTGYYAKMLERYKGNEALALAAYNWGPGNVDSVKGDLGKMPESVQTYVKTTLQRASGGGGAPAATGQTTTTTGQAPPTGGTPQEQAQLTAYNTRIATLEQKIEGATRIGGEEGRGRATAWERQRDNLAQERDRLRTRMLEPTRAAERLEAAKQTGAAAAERQLEARMNEPIGTVDGRKLNLPASTKWKDVPKDQRIIEDASATQEKAFADLNSAAKGVQRMQKYMENPEVRKMIGTFLTAPEASFNRLVGDWISTLSPEQRKFGATLAREVAQLRHDMIGAGQSGIEMESLRPFLPTPADVDPATLSAKLEALYEGILDKHDAYRETLDVQNRRVPPALARPKEKPPKDPKEKLLEKYTR